MKKKIIIASAVLIVLASGFGVSHAYIAYKEAAHTSSNNRYYTEDIGSLKEKPLPTIEECLSEADLPTREKIVTTPGSIFCLVNKEYSLPSDYVPEDLVVPDVKFSIDYESEKKYMRKVAADSLEEMFKAAKDEKLELIAVSGYRSYQRQQEIYEKNLKTRGTSHTNQYSAKPGYSEHQTGLVMDISCQSENFDLQESFGETPEGIWVAENAHLYGYIIRYPEEKCNITGYAYEPWHLRYVGVAMSTYLYQHNLTLDEYYHYKPSFDFITGKDQYINDTSFEYTNVGTYTPAPSSVANPNTNVTVSKSPVVAPSKQSVTKPSASVSPASKVPVSEAPISAPSEKPSTKPVASEKPSVKPSEKPAVKPSKAPATSEPEPSPEAPAKDPQPPVEENEPIED